jgi:hypothetical protein
MSANDDFLAADTVMIASFTARLQAPGTDAPLSQSNLCITKKARSLHLDLPIAAVPGAGPPCGRRLRCGASGLHDRS